MSNQEAIEQLKTTAPTVQLTMGQRAARIVGWVCSGLAVMALTVSVYATRQASQVSTCINTALGVRQQFTDADHANERQKIADQAIAVKNQAAGVRLILTGAPVQVQRGALLYQQGVNEFVESLARWRERDTQINAQRAKTPLGRC